MGPRHRGLVQVVAVAREREPSTVKALGVKTFPTVVVYGRGPAGLIQLAMISNCANAEAVVGRLRGLKLGIASVRSADPAVRAAAFEGDVHASQQAPPSCPVPTPQPQSPPLTLSPPQPQAPQQSLTLTPMQTTTAGVIQVPSQNFVIQQAPPQIFVAPTQAPVVYVPQTLTMSPSQPNQSLTLSPAPTPNPPAANLFLPSPTLTLAPTSNPPQTLTSGPPVALNAAPAAATLTTGPPAALAAVTNQTLSLPTSRATTRVRVRGPGPLASSLARLGERMTQLGRARIETVQETTLEAPLTQSGGGGLTTISTTSTTPVSQPPATLTLSPPHPSPPPVCPTPAPPPQPMASPQTATPHKHWWWQH